MKSGATLQDPIFEMDEQEAGLLRIAYFQMMIVKALLYFGTNKGKNWFVPVPAMLAMLIAKASYKWATKEDPDFLPANRLVGMTYPGDMIHRQDFWWDKKTVNDVDKMIRALPGVPHDIDLMLRWLLSEEYSILHPNGLAGIRIASWWPMRPCGAHQDNMMMHLTRRHCEEVAEVVLPRLGEEYTQWCSEVGEIFGKYSAHDNGIVFSRCSECHPTL